jgi:phasin family protein
MFSIPKKLSQVTKFAIDEQLLDYAALVEVAVDSGVSVVDLQVDVIKTSMAAAAVATNQFLSIKDGRDWLSLTMSQSQRAFEHASACARQAADIASVAQTRFSSLAQRTIDASTKADLAGAFATDPDQAAVIKLLPKKVLGGAHAEYDIPVLSGEKIKAGKHATAVASEARKQALVDDGQA